MAMQVSVPQRKGPAFQLSRLSVVKSDNGVPLITPVSLEGIFSIAAGAFHLIGQADKANKFFFPKAPKEIDPSHAAYTKLYGTALVETGALLITADRLITDKKARRRLHAANLAAVSLSLGSLARSVQVHGMDWSLGAAVPAAAALPVAAWSAFELLKPREWDEEE